MSELIAIEDQALLERTKSIRNTIVDELVGKGVSGLSKQEVTMLMGCLDGLDRTVFAKARIKSDDAANKTNANIQEQVAQLLLKVGPQINNSERDIPVLPDEHSIIDLVEGEAELGNKTFRYETFMNEI